MRKTMGGLIGICILMLCPLSVYASAPGVDLINNFALFERGLDPPNPQQCAISETAVKEINIFSIKPVFSHSGNLEITLVDSGFYLAEVGWTDIQPITRNIAGAAFHLEDPGLPSQTET